MEYCISPPFRMRSTRSVSAAHSGKETEADNLPLLRQHIRPRKRGWEPYRKITPGDLGDHTGLAPLAEKFGNLPLPVSQPIDGRRFGVEEVGDAALLLRRAERESARCPACRSSCVSIQSRRSEVAPARRSWRRYWSLQASTPQRPGCTNPGCRQDRSCRIADSRTYAVGNIWITVPAGVHQPAWDWPDQVSWTRDPVAFCYYGFRRGAGAPVPRDLRCAEQLLPGRKRKTNHDYECCPRRQYVQDTGKARDGPSRRSATQHRFDGQIVRHASPAGGGTWISTSRDFSSASISARGRGGL